uniref:Uncharacterized protein n=1 Tax=Zeugodacus cucurbitae TaxID=28588 RepID=A0A0A1WMH5_ZEUCU
MSVRARFTFEARRVTKRKLRRSASQRAARCATARMRPSAPHRRAPMLLYKRNEVTKLFDGTRPPKLHKGEYNAECFLRFLSWLSKCISNIRCWRHWRATASIAQALTGQMPRWQADESTISTNTRTTATKTIVESSQVAAVVEVEKSYA